MSTINVLGQKRTYAPLRKGKKKSKTMTRSKTKSQVKTMVKLGRGFPMKLMEQHTYVETIPLTTGVGGTTAYYIFSANGMYDPNISGTGHQPMFFDQMTAIYNHYCVIGSRAKIEIAQTADVAVDATVGCILNDDTAVPALNGFNEHPTSSHALFAASNTTRAPVVFYKYFSAKKNFGNFDQANSQFTGTSGSNPGEQMYYIVYADSTQAAAALTLRVTVTIEYTAIWSERFHVASS